jgi:hypothetical protein
MMRGKSPGVNRFEVPGVRCRVASKRLALFRGERVSCSGAFISGSVTGEGSVAGLADRVKGQHAACKPESKSKYPCRWTTKKKGRQAVPLHAPLSIPAEAAARVRKADISLSILAPSFRTFSR